MLYIQQQNSLHLDKPVHQLQKLSGTSWTCRFAAIEVVCTTFDAILATLQSLVQGDDKLKAVKPREFYCRYNVLSFG